VVVSEINGLKIYNLSAGKTFYELFKDSKFSFKQLKKNDDYVNRIEIIQEFEFPVSSQCIKLSEDGNYIVASGIYPPRVKIYDLNEMTLKVERGLDSEVRKLEILSTDYSKLAFFM
jgi:ribosome biogenesis protein ENP2